MAKLDDITAQFQQEIDLLKTAAKAREERDIAQDAVTSAQIKTLNDQLAALQVVQGSPDLTPEQVATFATMSASLQSVIDSLNAADPTAPAEVPAPVEPPPAPAG